MPFTLQDREYVKENGNFLDDYWGECRIRRLEWGFADDTAICDIEVNYNYIADSTYEEVIYDGN